MSTVAGTGLLLRHNLRRDRVIVVVWVGLLVVMAYASAAATSSLYPDLGSQLAAVELINDQPGIVALYGPVEAGANVGALAMSKLTVLYALFAAVLFVVLVRRHTRVEEESGRAELVGGTAVGRDAPLAAAVIESAAVAVVLGALCAIVDIAGGLDVSGSVYFGLSWLGTGLVGMGIAAVACQLATNARTCAALAAGSLGVVFVVRAVGDTTSAGWLGWVSPLGWNTRLHAWSDPRPWVLALYAGLTAALLVVAQVLRGHRDLGSGLVGARPGAARGSNRLASVGALVLRVHVTMVVVWTVAILALSAFFGAITPGIEGILKTQAGSRLVHDLGGSMMVAILSEVAVMVSCFAVTIVTHAGSDESEQRAELVLATRQSRGAWFTAVGLLAAVGSTWLLLVAGVGMWVGYGLAGGEDAHRALGAALVWAPGAWVVVGMALAGFALAARWAIVGWAWPFVFMALALVPPLLDWPGWVAAISPFDHVPMVPVDPMSWTPEIVLTLVAVAFTAAAWFRLKSRDIG